MSERRCLGNSQSLGREPQEYHEKISARTYMSGEDSHRAYSEYNSEAPKPTQIDRLLSIVNLSRTSLNSSEFQALNSMGLRGRAVKESTSIQLVNKLIVLSTIRRLNIAFTTLSALNPQKLRRYCPLLHTALQLFPALMKDGTIICVDTHTHTHTHQGGF